MTDAAPIPPMADVREQHRKRPAAVIAAVLVILLLAANAALTVVMVVSLRNVEATAEADSVVIEEVESLLREIALYTSPPIYSRAFCSDKQDLLDMYDDMVYDGPDNINQQGFRQREFRAMVLIYCER